MNQFEIMGKGEASGNGYGEGWGAGGGGDGSAEWMGLQLSPGERTIGRQRGSTSRSTRQA